MFESFTEGLLSETEQFLEFLPRLSIAVIVLVIIYWIGKLLGAALVKVLKRRSVEDTYLSFFSRLVSLLALFIGFIVFLNLIGFQTLATSLLAGGGITAVMLGFAFKDIGENLLAGVFIAFSRPFYKNDLIESEKITGRVQNVYLRHTHIRTLDGCDVFIPSAQLFTKPLYNYTLDGLRRGIFTIGIDYGDDAGAATELLLNSTTNIKQVLKKPAPSINIKGFDPNFVELQIIFWINAKDQEFSLPKIRTLVMESCRLALIREGFTFSSSVTTAIDHSPINVRMADDDTDVQENDL
jgi:small-conductance mechanosensitive channel